jgi:hypothetical protein
MAGTAHEDELMTVTLARSFVRDLDAAHACIAELQIVVSAGDSDQIAIVISLYSAWRLAESALSDLEVLIVDEVCHRFAQSVLQNSQERARAPLTRAWAQLRGCESANSGSKGDVVEPGGKMARDAGAAETVTTKELGASVLRQMNAANVCLRRLEVALNTGDREEMIAAAAALHDTWELADVAVATMRQRVVRQGASNREHSHYKLARNAVLAWRYFSRDPLRRMWSVLRDEVRRNSSDTRASATGPGPDARRADAGSEARLADKP